METPFQRLPPLCMLDLGCQGRLFPQPSLAGEDLLTVQFHQNHGGLFLGGDKLWGYGHLLCEATFPEAGCGWPLPYHSLLLLGVRNSLNLFARG